MKLHRAVQTTLLAGVLASCGSSPEAKQTDKIGSATAPYIELDAPRLARRMSLDIRGILPTVDELDRVEASSDDLDRLVEAWLDSPEFEQRMMEVYAERWRTEVDEFMVYYWEYGLTEEQQYDYLRSIGQEPVRLIARVAASDLPYTTIVTADWTMTNELLEQVFPIERSGSAEEGWTEGTYTDGRPPAGVLSTNGLWWRYPSPIFNYSRRRSAAILDLLVCDDLLVRPVIFNSPDLTDTEAAEEAVRTNEDCLTCHSTIEPISAALFGFEPQDVNSIAEVSTYHPEREANGPAVLHVEPGWAGQPVDGLAGLGRAIAADTRFVDCAVETISRAMLRRATIDADTPWMRGVRDRFVESDLRLKEAIRAVVATPTYRAGSLTDDASDAVANTAQTRRLLVGPQLRRAIAQRTGLVWERDGADELDNDFSGYRVLLGGVDGESVTRPPVAPGANYIASTRRLAQAAARTWLDGHASGEHPFVQLDDCAADATPEDPCFRERLRALSWSLHAVRPTDAQLDGWTDLWAGAHDLTGDPVESLAVVLSAMFRDPAFLTY